MFKQLLLSLWSNDEICHYIKDLHSTVIPSTQAVLNPVPDVLDGDEPSVPDVRVHGGVLSVPDVQECVAESEVRCSLP